MEGSTAVAMEGTIREQVEDVVVRFAGDSGDGVQITGCLLYTSPSPRD